MKLQGLMKQFEDSSRKQQLNILFSALDYMKEYNGRSRWDCIALAMGYVDIEGMGEKYQKKDT